VYFGDLKGVIAAFAGALRPNGLFVFTLEHAVGDGADVDYRLEFHGRYSHARAYVEQLLTSSGLQSKIIQAELRMEAGAPVLGLVIRARSRFQLMPDRSSIRVFFEKSSGIIATVPRGGCAQNRPLRYWASFREVRI
jgi:hypothetical protein